jgi:hypothetical protein
MDSSETCPGCGLVLETVKTGTHEYLGASPSCFSQYGELISRRYAEFRTSARANKLVTDAYAVQHPGVPERRSIQSVNVHLVAMYLILEKGFPSDKTIEPMKRLIAKSPPWGWLDPPKPNGELTVADLVQLENVSDYEDGVERYAQSIWKAWQAHRVQVVNWANSAIQN